MGESVESEPLTRAPTHARAKASIRKAKSALNRAANAAAHIAREQARLAALGAPLPPDVSSLLDGKQLRSGIGAAIRAMATPERCLRAAYLAWTRALDPTDPQHLKALELVTEHIDGPRQTVHEQRSLSVHLSADPLAAARDIGLLPKARVAIEAGAPEQPERSAAQPTDAEPIEPQGGTGALELGAGPIGETMRHVIATPSPTPAQEGGLDGCDGSLG